MLMGSVAAAGAATLEFIGSGSVAAAITTTIPGVSFGAAAVDREIIVVFSTVMTTASVSSVSIGGVTAAPVTVRSDTLPSNFGLLACARATVPSGASGNIVITYPIAPSAVTEYAVYRVTGRVSVGSSPSDTTSAATSSAATTATLTSIDTPVGGFVLSAVITQSLVTPTISGAGLTVDTPASANRGFASSLILTAANSNASATWTFSSSVRCVCAAFSFSP